MIVIDASALLEMLLKTDVAEQITSRVLSAAESLHAPHLLDIEVSQALRRLVQQQDVSARRGEEALEDLEQLVIERHPHLSLLTRIWQLRNALTAYDAAYVALSEALAAPLLTCDAKLARAHGHRARIELIER